MGKSRTGKFKKGSRINCLAFKWKDKTVYLPTIVIRSSERLLADTHVNIQSEKNRLCLEKTSTDVSNISRNDDIDEESHVSKKDKKEKDYGVSTSADDDDCNKTLEDLGGNESGEMVNNKEKLDSSSVREGTPIRDRNPKDPKSQTVVEGNDSADLLKEKRKALFKNLMENAASSSSAAPSNKCNKCDKEYKNEDSHVCSSIQNNLFSTNRSSTLHNNPAELKCWDCGKTFTKRLHLTLHQKIHASMDKPLVRPVSRTFPCNYCDSKFERNDDLLSHYQRQHNISNNFHVHQLNSGTKNASQQQQDDDVEEKLDCKHCNRKFTTVNQVKYHSLFCKPKTTKNVANINKKESLVRVNEGDTKDDTNLDAGDHFLYQQGDSKTDRNTIVDTSEVIDDTLKEERTPSSLPYRCTHCDKAFKFMHYLRFHERIHFQSCSKCKARVLKSEYSQHLTSCDKEDVNPVTVVPHVIETSLKDDESLYSPSLQDEDNESINEETISEESKKIPDDQPTESDTDQETFTDDFVLNQHHLVHEFSFETTGDCSSFQYLLPFSCLDVQCPSKFSHQDDLLLHMRKKHPSQDFRCCEKCHREFSSTFNLMRHRSSAHGLERSKRPVHQKKDDKTATSQSSEKEYRDHPTYYYQQPGFRHKEPPDPYVLLTDEIKRLADNKGLKRPSIQSKSPSGAELSRGRGKVRTDIPFQNTYRCKICSKKFPIRQQYLVHLSQHKRLERNKCQICSKGFLSQKLLMDHTKRHEDPSYNPSFGGKFRTDIPIQNEYTCKKCNQVFEERKPFLIHIWTHKQEERNRCDMCDRGFLSTALLQQHKRRHLDPSYTPELGRLRRTDVPIQSVYTCDICEKTFTQSQRNLFFLHMREHKFQCDICQKSFQSQNLLNQHKKCHQDPNYSPDRPTGRVRTDIPFQSVYTCEKCDKRFSQRRLFLIHLNQHKMYEKYSCQFCDRKFMTEATFQDHIRRHEDPSYVPGLRGGRLPRTDIPEQDSYTCEICSKVFDQRRNFMMHLSQHKREEKYTCQLCERKFPSNSLLEEHLERHKDPAYVPGKRGRFRTDIPVQDSYTCDVCTKTFDDRRNYLLHLSQHERENKFSCTLCDKKFQSDFMLQLHIKRHDDPTYVPRHRGRGPRADVPEQDSYTCATCKKVFEERRPYILHINNHERESRHSCPLCPLKFLSNSSLQTHLTRHQDPSYVPRTRAGARKRVHIDLPHQDVYHCEYCQKEYSERKAFIQHLWSHKREPKHGCHVCERKFFTNKLLHEHLRKHLNPAYRHRTYKKRRTDIPVQNEYVCDKCDRIYLDRHAFLVHLFSHKQQDQNSEDLQCNICNKAFLNKARLISHMLNQHSDSSSFPGVARRKRTNIPIQDVYHCELCDNKKTFTSRQKYLLHIRYHSLEEKFACPHCPRRFKVKQLLDDHIDTHNTRKIYECQDCKKMFRTKSTRYFHGKFCKKIPCKVQCNLCDDRFHNDVLLQKHFKRVHVATLGSNDTDTEKQVDAEPSIESSCSHCSQRFPNEYLLHRHIIIYHPKTVDAAKTQTSILNMLNNEKGSKNQQSTEPTPSTNGNLSLSAINSNSDKDCSAPESSTSLSSWSPANNEGGINGNENDEVDDPDDPDFDISDMLATDFLETEMTDETTESLAQSIPASIRAVNNKRDGPKHSYSRNACNCGERMKYKSQKFCHNRSCPCVKRNKMCHKKCHCTNHCLNNSNSEKDQQQKFKEGRENMFLEEQAEAVTPFTSPENVTGEESPISMEDDGEPSVPILIGEPVSLARESTNQPSSSSSAYVSIIPSEFISVDGNEEEEGESMHDVSGFINESDDVDPLADPLDIPEPQPVETTNLLSTVHSIITTHLRAPLPQAPVVIISRANPSLTIQTLPVSTATATTAITSASSIAVTSTDKLSTDNTTANLHCQFCKKIFKTIPSFICHFLVHGGEIETYSCRICTQSFQYIADFLRHLNGHNKGIDVQCTICSSKFKTYKDVEKHLKVHHYKPLECGLCLAKFPDTRLLMSHWSKEHPTCQCGLCMVKFFSYDDLTFHMKSLHTPFDCVHCGARFEILDPLLNHFLEAHYLELASKNSTSHIVKSTTTSSTSGTAAPQDGKRLSAHISRLSKFKCDCCGFLFSNKQQLDYHLASKLTSGLPSQQGINRPLPRCDECGQTFSDLLTLHNHLAQHIDGTIPTFPTTSNTAAAARKQTRISPSNSGSLSRSSSVVYISSMNPEESPTLQQEDTDNLNAKEVFNCPKCSKLCSSRAGLLIHIRGHGALPFCSGCITLFNSREELLSHLNPQRGKKASCVVFECQICLKNYTTKASLTGHVKQVHGEGQLQGPITLTPTHLTETEIGDVNAMSDSEETVPIIIASTSLAPSQGGNNKPTKNYVTGSTCLQQDVEEIVLD